MLQVKQKTLPLKNNKANEMKKEKLRVSTYARRLGVSTTEVYRMIKDKRIKSIKIDNVQFVIVDHE